MITLTETETCTTDAIFDANETLSLKLELEMLAARKAKADSGNNA